MLNRMFASLIFICLCIAIPLSLMGITHVEIGPSTMAFLQQTSMDLAKWKLEIPNIPDIPSVPSFSDNGFWEAIKNILNAIIGFFNFIVALINVFLQFLNFIIAAVQYLFLLVKNFFILRDTLASVGSYA